MDLAGIGRRGPRGHLLTRAVLLALALALGACYRLGDLETAGGARVVTRVGAAQTTADTTLLLPSGLQSGDVLLLTVPVKFTADLAGWTTEGHLTSECGVTGVALRRVVDGSEGGSLDLSPLPTTGGAAVVGYRGAASFGAIYPRVFQQGLANSFDAPIAAAPGDLVFIRVFADQSAGATWTASDAFAVRAQVGSLAMFDGAVDTALSGVHLTASTAVCAMTLAEALTPG